MEELLLAMLEEECLLLQMLPGAVEGGVVLLVLLVRAYGRAGPHKLAPISWPP